MANSTATGTALCSWCSKVITHGDPQLPITHGICWRCLEANFPDQLTKLRAECDHEFDELVEREHQSDGQPVRYNYATETIIEQVTVSHLDTMRCLKCGQIQVLDLADCDCEPDDDDPPDDDDRDEVRFDESEDHS